MLLRRSKATERPWSSQMSGKSASRFIWASRSRFLGLWIVIVKCPIFLPTKIYIWYTKCSLENLGQRQFICCWVDHDIVTVSRWWLGGWERWWSPLTMNVVIAWRSQIQTLLIIPKSWKGFWHGLLWDIWRSTNKLGSSAIVKIQEPRIKLTD